MRLSSSVMAVVGTAAGVVAAALAYQAGTGGPASVSSGTQRSPAATVGASPAPVVKWQRCEHGSTLRHGTCVTVKRKVVVVDDPAPVPAPQPAAGDEPQPGHDGDGHHGDGRDDIGETSPAHEDHAARHDDDETEDADDDRSDHEHGHSADHDEDHDEDDASQDGPGGEHDD